MKAFVITIENHKYSEDSSLRCIRSGKTFGVDVDVFNAVTPNTVNHLLKEENLQWNWANNNTSKRICPITGLLQIPYRTKNLEATKSCAMSHYLLWKKCVELNEPLLILEHDAFFVSKVPDIEFKGAMQIFDPRGNGNIGKEHYELILKREKIGAQPLSRLPSSHGNIPTGFTGNSAYLIKPWAAEEFINAYHKFGVWPNDATICLQLFPWLEEYYPFITKYDQTLSTSTSE